MTTISSPPVSQGGMASNLVSDKGGAWLTWIEPMDKEKQVLRLRCSKYDAGKWSDPRTIVQGSNFFANWADFPEMGVANDGDLFVTWPQKSGPGTYAYDIAVARSVDEGKSWFMMGTLNDDRVLGEHGFVSLVPDGETEIRAFWLDGRAMTGDGHGGEGGGDMQLRTTRIGNEVHNSELIDDRTCECCGTDATIGGGEPVVVYRDRSNNEVRDISIASLQGTPAIIHEDKWNIAGCPVNGPSIDAIGTTSVVAWFTAPENNPKAFAVFKNGDNVGDPILISNSTLGRVDVVMVDPKTAVVCWIELGENDASIQISVVHDDGRITQRKHVSDVASSRSSGFPRIVKVDEGILVVWTDLDREIGIDATIIALTD